MLIYKVNVKFDKKIKKSNIKSPNLEIS